MRPAGVEMSWRTFKVWVDIMIYLWGFFETGVKVHIHVMLNICLELVRAILLPVSSSK